MKNSSSYSELPEDKKKEFIENKYLIELMSIADLAGEIGHSISFLNKEMARFGIEKRTRGESLKLSIASGKHAHPTKGKKHSQETKDKIAKKRAETWDNISDEDRKEFVKKRKASWAKMSKDQIANLQSAAHMALRTSAKDGSKLEKILTQALLDAGYVVEYHKTALVSNENLEMDLFLPKMNIVIEIDGPTHFLPIFGPDRLAKTQAKDAEKNGLLLNAGYIVIRLQQYKKKNITKKFQEKIIEELLMELTKIKINPPVKIEDRLILIKED